jgi:predicted dinucleotide-binding enzyme
MIRPPFSDRTVAIIGTGNIGGRLAAKFAESGLPPGRPGPRGRQETRLQPRQPRGSVSLGEAIERADVLVFAAR